LEIRERIVETAFLLFETQGYEATTVTEIAEQADIAYGTLFQHFPSKLDLLREVSGRALGRLFENVEEVSKRPGSFAERLVMLFDTTAENAESMGPQTRELISAMLAHSIPETAGEFARTSRSTHSSKSSSGPGIRFSSAGSESMTTRFVNGLRPSRISWRGLFPHRPIDPIAHEDSVRPTSSLDRR